MTLLFRWAKSDVGEQAGPRTSQLLCPSGPRQAPTETWPAEGRGVTESLLWL